MAVRVRASIFALLGAALVASACSYQVRQVAPALPDEAQSSRIYAADGTQLTTFFFEENRTNVTLDEMPDHLTEAVIAIEDERFYQHTGVDVRAVLRALRENTESGEIAEGGSTITQQYVKNALIDDDEQTLARKIEEASIAFQLERQYTKDRILELYLNTIYFGNGAYGVQAASFEYFAKPAADLELAESALLAGLIQSPTRHDPYRRADAARARRDLVLDRMVANGFISDELRTATQASDLALTDESPATEEVYAAPYFVEEVKQWFLDDPRFGETRQQRNDLLFGGGLRIHTTVDLRAQFLAEAAMWDVLPAAGSDPDVALVAIDPRTGYVVAMVGGRDFFGDSAQKFNLATQGGRQGGSAAKPFVLATALERDMPLETVYPAPGSLTIPAARIPRQGAEDWQVENYGGGGTGATDLVTGTLKSYNTVYAQLVVDVTANAVADTATRVGITSPIPRDPNGDAYEAIALGSGDVTAFEMASAYGTFANRGVRVPPAMVTRITRSDGSVVYEHRHTQRKVLRVETADQVTNVLAQNIESGTGTAAGIGRPAAGKTGTASDWKDAWFVGYTPELATAVWVGYKDEQIAMVPPRTPIRVTGGSYPARIWSAFMGLVLEDRTVTTFPEMPTTTTSTTAPTTRRPSGGSTSTAERAVVPSVVGLTWDAAEAAITENGFRARRADVDRAGQKPGRVLTQAPPAGSRAPIRSIVTVEVRTE